MNEFANILQTVMGKRTVQFWLVGLLFSLAIISVVAGPTVLQAETGFTLDLTSLEVTDSMGTTIDLGTFDPAVRTYSANVASTVERVTVTARPESDSGVKVNLAPRAYRPDHNRWEVEGREVSINHGRNLILIGVFSYWVDEPLRVYTVENQPRRQRDLRCGKPHQQQQFINSSGRFHCALPTHSVRRCFRSAKGIGGYLE